MTRSVFKLNRDYVWEKLFAGLTSVADRAGSVTERLANAYESQLNLLESDDPSDLDVPVALYSEMQGLLRDLREPLLRRTNVTRSDLHAVDEMDASELVSRLVMLYGKVVRLLSDDHVAAAPINDEE